MREEEYRALLSRIAQEITFQQLLNMKFLSAKSIPYAKLHSNTKEDILAEVFDFFCKLESLNKLGIDDLDWMSYMLEQLKAEDLVSEVTTFQSQRRVYLSSLSENDTEARNQTTICKQKKNKKKEDQRRRSEPEVGQVQKAAVENQNSRGTILMKCAPYIAGAAWVAASAYILNLHKKNPKALVNMVTKVVLPTGIFVRSIFPGSINFLLQATDLNSLKELWKRYQTGQLKEDLQEVLVTEELKNLANGEPIDLEVQMSEEEYRNACLDLMIAQTKAHTLCEGIMSSEPALRASRSLPNLTSLDTLYELSGGKVSRQEIKDSTSNLTRKLKEMTPPLAETFMLDPDLLYAKEGDMDHEEKTLDISGAGMVSKTFTDEELNYFRLCYVITLDVPKGLRGVFKQEWDARYQATHGQWLDVPKNATDFYSMESPKNQRRNARLLTIMANGNTNQWNCTCLFYAILFSDCLGPFLNTAVQNNVEILREIRNRFAHTTDGRLKDVDFKYAMLKILAAFKVLGLDTTKVEEIKNQKSFQTEELYGIRQQLNTEKKRYAKLHSFCVLPPKPSHDTTERVDEVMTINHEMERLKRTKKNETTVIYLSGNPGCGKSEIARQIGNSYFDKIPEDTAQLKFVFTFNASSMDTLLQSYVDFAARLSCDEDSVTRITTSEVLSAEQKIKNIQSLINPKVQNYSSWLIVVDNVNDLKLFSKYLPQAGEKTSGDGQILVTTQDSQSIPLDSYTYHYSSLKSGMKEEEAIALLTQISGCTGDRDTLLNIASTLDFQPLALACAAVYMQRIMSCPGQSETKWEKYLLKLQEAKREATEKVYGKTTPTYQSANLITVTLALKLVSEDKIMMHAFQFLSEKANEPIPLKYVVQHVIKCMPGKDEDLVANLISLSSLVLSSEADGDNSKVICVHQVVYHGLQKLFQKQ